MAKVGKLMKLKSVLKKWNSFGSNKHNNVTTVPISDLHSVYVGKSRRLYRLTSDVVHHPLFREMVERSRDEQQEQDDDNMNVACEVVLFEHMLWMLHNADSQPESLHELVHFYSY